MSRTSIQEIANEFINEIVEYFASPQIKRIDEIEHGVVPKIRAATTKLVNCYLETLDAAIVADKSGRRKEGFVVERRGDARQVLTQIGTVEYQRTYFKGQQGYSYLLDELIGLHKYERVSAGTGVELVEAVRDMSYAKSSAYVTNGNVSRQTVMRKLRSCEVRREQEPQTKRKVACLHIDADEDHVTMRGGHNSEVWLISVYEGVKRQGTRGICQNIFHISGYGKTSDELWEHTLSELERRYELDGTRIYLHGDGAAWIKTGLEWLPNAIFVLDKYHKNKAIAQMLAGLSKANRSHYGRNVRFALEKNDKLLFDDLEQCISLEKPERADKIAEAAAYLRVHMNGIHICSIDPEANNGGCTEPHVSHVLSSRLSSRPMAWSAQTLTALAPILADRNGVLQPRIPSLEPPPARFLKAARAASKAFKKRGFLPHPDSLDNIEPLKSGKMTWLHSTLKAIAAPNSL